MITIRKGMKIMKKTTYLIVISVITIVCVIAGSIYHIGGFSIPGVFRIGSGKSDTKVTSIELDDGSVSADTVDLDKFSNIDMDLQVMDVTIQRGDSLGLSYECSKKEYIPVIDVKDDLLTVRQNIKKKRVNMGKIKCKMVLTVPENFKFENVEIRSDVGDLKIDGIDGDAFIFESDTGDIKLASITGKELEISGDTGDIKLSGCSFTNTDISGNTGDVKLDNCERLGEISVDNDTGNIIFENCKLSDPDGNINISTDTGDVRIGGVDDLGRFTTDFETDLGDVKVNGKNYNKHYSEKASSGDASGESKNFIISTNIGDIVVD